jgi:hypothetical protein
MFPFPTTYTYEETVRKTVTVYDVYGDKIPDPPKGKRYVAFRPPLPNDNYLAIEGGRCLGPRLIIGDVPKPKRFLKVPMVEGDTVWCLVEPQLLARISVNRFWEGTIIEESPEGAEEGGAA